MKAPFSPYLTGIAPAMKRIVALLGEEYDYVSILSTDSSGFRMSVGQRAVAVANATMTTERGNVIRVMKDGLVSEYAFNTFDPEHPEITAREAVRALDAQIEVLKITGSCVYETELLGDEPLVIFEEFETETLPETCDQEALIRELTEISNLAMEKGEGLIDARLNAQSTHISKMFLTKNRDLRQSYVYSEGNLIPIAVKDGRNSYTNTGVSGRVGPEIFKQLREKVDDALKVVGELLLAERIEPGEYDIITSPEVSGLIAHEAFGHGVEMDMFVKGRALGAEYIDKRVGSDLVTMHEGALCATNVTTYAFDDEGTPAGDVVEIDHGILKTGICDALAAKRLGTKPTGNGKRQNFEHKVYTRMTNTVFDSGNDNLDDMIASIDHGYLLCGMRSGMEDPKHWGIQCIIERGYEIKDGKMTGKIVAPIVMTGYVPDLLCSVSMASTDRGIFGCGGCGKGYKEWVKVADGGPYLKAKARLG
ncbi:MAG: TldD/PmbA family protein [Lachnospiraceae bacterium]|nr:TldD/PmbA family protein [Lachnospiraceae bacterium]